MKIQTKVSLHRPELNDPANQALRGDKTDRSQLLRRAISRWESEGGAAGNQAPERSTSGEVQTEVGLTNAELVQLQIRVIALENLVTALLTDAPDQTRDLARAMATNISPRPGRTPHHLTIHAAAQMVHLVERASPGGALKAAETHLLKIDKDKADCTATPDGASLLDGRHPKSRGTGP
ncbi:hypothetical protein SRS16P2_00351 (plasmid) [Variovorax sp. SRS16]|uniref:hypothetical protein n=1 Tax=Variovorax sp. SRS16 TaxID=282217 RepID=UPI0013172387|nr:hypothetical protein SRS16P2_00351 [Variovorax sp. SRS16]